MDDRKISIQELHANEEGGWKVKVQLGSDEWFCHLQDPALTYLTFSRSELEWVLSQYPLRFPNESARSEAAFEELPGYAASLHSQLHLHDHILASREQRRTHPETRQSLDFVIEVQDAGPGSMFHAVLWEALEFQPWPIAETDSRQYIFRICRVDRTADLPQQMALNIYSIESACKESFNILFVVSRPAKDSDIDPYLACSAVLKTLFSLPLEDQARVKIEIARPGTWSAFEKHITTRTRQWEESGGLGPWYDIVHFDVHGVVHNGHPYLRFLFSSGKKELRRNSKTVGELLRDNKVHTVFMNSCESAKVTESEASNMAKNLLAYGVSTVIAMQFPFTASAALVFIRCFYGHLFESGSDVLAAVCRARQRLFSEKGRAASLGMTVEIPDFIIPVIYTTLCQGDTPGFGLANLDYPSMRAIQRALFLQKMKDYSERYDGIMLGRNYDAFNLESSLLRRRGPNIAVISGAHGAGKSMFARWLLYWWCVSGLCNGDFTFWSYEKLPSSLDESNALLQLRDLYASEDRDRVIRELRGEYDAPISAAGGVMAQESSDVEIIVPRKIIVLDGLDFAFHSSGTREDVMETDRWRLRDFLHRLAGSRTIVLLTTTTAENWLNLRTTSFLLLKMGGIPPYHAYNLARRVLKTEEHKDLLNNPTESRYMLYLFYRLHFNPASIIHILEGFAKRPDFSIQQAFHDSLLSFVQLADEDSMVTQVTKCRVFLHNLIKVLDFDKANILMLLAFAIPSGAFSSSLFEYMAHETNSFLNDSKLTDKEVSTFFERYCNGSGWIEPVLQNADSQEVRHFIIHPLFTNELRGMLYFARHGLNFLPTSLDGNDYARWRYTLDISFYSHLARRETRHRWGVIDSETRINFMNHLAALEFFLGEGDVFTRNPQLSELRLDTSLELCYQLWIAVPSTTTYQLPLEVMVKHAEQALQWFEEFNVPLQLRTQSAIYRYCKICGLLTQFYAFKTTEKALEFARRSIRVSSHMILIEKAGFATMVCWEALNDLAYISILVHQRVMWMKATVLTSLLLCRASTFKDNPVVFYKELINTVGICRMALESLEDQQTSRMAVTKTISFIARIRQEQSLEQEEKRDEGKSQFLRFATSKMDPWTTKSVSQELTTINIEHMKAFLLLDARQFTSAKTIILAMLKTSVQTGDRAHEHFCQRAMFEVYFRTQEWDPARKHATRALQLYRNRENSRAMIFAQTEVQTVVMFSKFAITFIHCGDWMSALHCFELIFYEKLRTGEGFNPPQLSDYETPRDFLLHAKILLRRGVNLLALMPYFLVSSGNAQEIADSFDIWFNENRQITRSYLNETAATNSSDLGKLVREKVDEMQNYGFYSPLSRAELDACLWLYVPQETPSNDPSSEKSHMEQQDMNQRKDDEAKLLLDFPAILFHLISNIITWRISERTESEPAYRGLHLYPLPPLSYFINIALQSCAHELAEAGLAMAPVVNWERLERVSEGWVKDRMSFVSSDDGLGDFLELLVAIYEGDGSVAADPSREDFEMVIKIFVDGEKFSSTQIRKRNVHDAQVLKKTMEILLPDWLRRRKS